MRSCSTYPQHDHIGRKAPFRGAVPLSAALFRPGEEIIHQKHLGHILKPFDTDIWIMDPHHTVKLSVLGRLARSSRVALSLYRSFLLFGLIGLAGGGFAQATDLIISEYVEGSNNSKYIEVYNGTVASIDLSDYELRLYSNGDASPSNTTPLAGTLTAGWVVVYKHTSATAYVGTATTATAVNFSGDDAVVLWKISTNIPVDIFGNIGCQPSVEWEDAEWHTENRTLVRNANICNGISVDPNDTPCSFPTLASEWTVYPKDDVSHLGSHTMHCGPTVNFDISTSAELESTSTAMIDLSIEPTASTEQTVYIHLSYGPDCAYGLGNDLTTLPPQMLGDSIAVIIPANASSVPFTVELMNDGIMEGLETVSFTITSATSGIYPGVHVNHVFTIHDDDDTSPATVLERGDILVVGMASSINACLGNVNDEISFICFKNITSGTSIILTDNGYERTTALKWGDSEGMVKFTRIGPTILAGQVITLRSRSTAPVEPCMAFPDDLWTASALPGTFVDDLNISDPDQLFFLQGDDTDWDNPTAAHNASWSGRILFGITTKVTEPWEVDIDSLNNSSNLPPGMECYSMALSSSTFQKYTGPVTETSQGGWIARVGNLSNWSTYSECYDFHDEADADHNWLDAPLLPIYSGRVAGLWRGAVNTDWFECKNWDDATVPDIGTAVTIDEAAARDCEIGISGSPLVSCASLELSSGSATVWNLRLLNGADLDITTWLSLSHPSGSAALTVDVGSNSTLSADSVKIVGNTNSGAAQAALVCDQNGSVLNITGDVVIGSGGLLDLSNTSGNSGTLNLGGDFINSADEVHFDDAFSTVQFNGTWDQKVSNSGFSEYFGNVWVNKVDSGIVLLEDSITIRGTLDLTDGLITDTLPNTLVTFLGSASVINASDSSFVYGPVEKYGTTDFTFPIGKNGFYRPSKLENIAGLETDAFLSEYFGDDPEDAVGSFVQSPELHHISNCEYWNIERSVGNANARVVLTWDTPASCGVTSDGTLNDLRIAHWDGTIWQDRGQADHYGDYLSGGVATFAVETSFSPWTLASISSNNPLPIELLSFDAKPNGAVVELAWSTASEWNNDYFTVERSADAEHFVELLRQTGAGNSHSVLNYFAIDADPFHGDGFYRLRQTDFDGRSTVSSMVPVHFNGIADISLSVFYSEGALYLLHGFPTGSRLDVMDLTGRIVSTEAITTLGMTPVPTTGLSHGVYLLRITDGARVDSKRFAY